MSKSAQTATCRECGGSDFYRHEVAAKGGYGPNLLPGVGITTLRGIADALTEMGEAPPRGGACWTTTQVRRVIDRLEAMSPQTPTPAKRGAVPRDLPVGPHRPTHTAG